MGRALALTSMLLAACGSSPSPPVERPALVDDAPAPPGCLADRVPATVPPVATPIECGGTEAACREACDDGAGAMCLSLAYVLEPDPATKAEAVQLFGRGCELGDLNACTNYGAYLIDGLGGLAADPPCAVRLHQRACDGGETYGCGMLGRELALGVGIERDVARAREVLETACAALGGFACQAQGWLLERGDLGVVDREGAAAAFRRSCETDNPYACPDAERLEKAQP